MDALAPGIRPDALTAWLEPHRGRSTVAIVGHEPTLSIAVAWLTAGGTKPFLELKTGGVCCLEFDGSIAPGAATLRWAMTPKQLRALGD